MKKTILILLLGLFCCQLTFAQKKKKVLLEYKYQVGQKYHFIMNTSQQIGIQGIEIPQNMTFGMDYEIMAVDKEGTANVKITYQTIKFVQDNPMMGKMEYDSESTTEPNEQSKTITQAFAQLKGKWVVVKMKKNGEMLDAVEGDPTIAKAMNDQGGSTLGSYPEKPVKVGESWTKTEKKNSNGVVMNISTTTTLKAFKAGKWLIEVSGTIQDEKGVGIGTQTGSSELDAKDIMLVISNTKQDISELPVQGMKMKIKAEYAIQSSKK
jgi:hypothetical protein